MKRSMLSRGSILWPLLVAAAIASFYVRTQPGEIYADAAEYDQIAHSILQGNYELREEFSEFPEPTMHREPGYPVFRAAVYTFVGDHPSVILWLQVLLSCATIFVAARAIRRVNPRWELPTAWLTALYPGFAVWAGQHYSELFAAFLAAVTGYAWVRLWEVRDHPLRARLPAIALGCAMGVLTLTKATFQMLPLAAAGILLATGGIRARWKQALIVLVAFGAILSPWLIRNALRFDQTAVTYRSGVVLYSRALKAQIPWSQLATSYGSVLFGQATMLHFVPETPPIIIQEWKTTWDEKNALLHEGMRYYQADSIMFGRAARTLFSSPVIFAKYILWSPIDVLRFFELTSPLSPKFGVELVFSGQAREGTLTTAHLGVLSIAHILQLVWWVLIGAGFIILIRRRQWEHPALLLVGYAAMIHAPFDNIPRYAVPILPWIMALIVAVLVRSRSSNGFGMRDQLRPSDARIVEAANKAYHRVEASLYDQAHPEILWCERANLTSFADRHIRAAKRPITVLDIGAGTGFVGNIFKDYLVQGDRYVATDLSPEMLEVLQRNLHDSKASIETVVCSADDLRMPDNSVDVVIISSVVHHLSNVEGMKAEAARVLKPGGVFAVMHEPNIAFSQSWFFRQTARFASVCAARIDAPGPSKPGVDYAPVYDAVNEALLREALIDRPLEKSDIQRLVDVHSPTASGRYEPFGFAARQWTERGALAGWGILSYETYNYLGKLDPSARAWRRMIEGTFRRLLPGRGSLFSAVYRKPSNMNVLLLCEDADPSNGWGRYASSLTRALRANGTNVTILTSDASSEGPRLPGFSSARFAWILAGLRLRWWLRTHRFDVIHVAAEHEGRLSASFGETPFVITIHGTYADPRAQGPSWAARAFERSLSNACRLIAVSGYTEEKIAEPLRSKTDVILNGVDLDMLREPSTPPKECGRPLVLSVGALKPRKGFDRLICGFAEFAKDRPDAELVIVGGDAYVEYKESLLRLALELGIAERVRLTGKVSRAELLGWYRACDVFALTPVSDAGFEGFGLVYIEANLFGKPSVGSIDSGARDAIKQGVSGFLVRADDAQDVARGITEALTLERDPIIRYAESFAWKNRVPAYLEAYRAARVSGPQKGL